MGDKGKDIMVTDDRTVNRRGPITGSRRREAAAASQVARHRRPTCVVIRSSPAHVPDEGPVDDSEREMSRGLHSGFEEDISEDDEEDDTEEEELHYQFLANQILVSPNSKVVIREDRDRYVRRSQSSYSTTRKKPKRDLSWRLTGSVPGGPSHFHVLRSFGGHVAHTSWTDPDKLRPYLKCYERSGYLESLNDIKMLDVVSQRVSESGLGHLRHCMTTNLDENLISAFIERWQPDTNTFHMPFGEISILLHDVYHILGIRVDGRSVFVSGSDEADEEDSMREDEIFKRKVAIFLGVGIESVVPPTYKGGALLTQRLRSVVEKGNQHDSLRAYMMMLLGQTLFMDKSNDRVIAQMLGLFDDLSVVSEYAWGAATLAYLYRQLGMATRVGARGVAGCLSLLQAWIYEYFPDFRPHRGYYLDGQPRVRAWSRVPRFEGDATLLEDHRQRLDGLRAEHVSWTPYGFRPDRQCPTTLYSGLIRFLYILEPYQPDRCLRQFGYCQSIPMHMITPASDSRPANLGKRGYWVYFGDYADVMWGFEDARVDLRTRSRFAVMPMETAPNYMAWYEKISHRYFYPPSHRLQFSRPPIMDEPEPARALSRKFSLIYRAPTQEARDMVISRLIREMKKYFTVDDDDEDADDDDDDYGC